MKINLQTEISKKENLKLQEIYHHIIITQIQMNKRLTNKNGMKLIQNKTFLLKIKATCQKNKLKMI